MNLYTKGFLLIAIPGAIELALLGAVFHTQAQTAAAAQSVVGSGQILYLASSVMDPLLGEAVRVRTALVTGDPSLAGGNAVAADLARRLAQLDRLVADSPAERQRVQEMRAALDTWHAHTAAIGEALRDNRDASTRALAERDDVPAPIAVFRDRLDALITAETARDAARRAALAETRKRQQFTLIAAIVGSMLIWAMTALVVARHFGRRVAVLTDNARRLGDGEPLAQPLPGDDEISALDAVLHQTGARLRAAGSEHATLKAKLQSRAAELVNVNEELRQGTQDNEMFIYSVSHDLRSPLVNLQGFSKELQVSCDELRSTVESANLPAHEQQRLAAVLDGNVRESLQFLRISVTRAAAIIEALLTISRAGRLEYHLQRVSVGRVVARAVDALQGAARERAAVVTVRELPPVWGDPGAIEQIFSHLIGNALNYLDPARPGQIEVGALEPDATETPLPDGRTRTYYVRDNGLGIPSAYMSKVFHAFQRLHGDIVKGEGIGLALVRRIVERHGGRVWVESAEGVGSTFFVSLPEQPARNV
ncbi:sensor histidine kinase [Paraburkholderia saeva]|uniref:histidine kinase n=1 Tax=Paraburkholderia saeva TaxID=2777537 RepID=A0A9N8X2T9_9BURK|nr:ATP-binding protein [Paraburkholderia saeva]CAG4892098.1 Adaptive-response sensory-kinase SasA [Paraburkholderia saeva]CAG4895230.1 Adaptive-response sensory-kinase SasA [Paraburkholderia saeva]CAG4904354.1 Adaptive-response sensory-kinase SasA [Paraburkholderia saeva]